MAQRRSRNRRSSVRRSSNITADFDENTNVIDNDDPLWFDRTIIRPSTSLVLTKRGSSLLNSASTVPMSEMSDQWYENFSSSDNSMQMINAVRKNINNRLNNEKQKKIRNEAQNTESESDQEFRKKRSKFTTTKRKKNETDNTNAFSKALDRSFDSRSTLTNPRGSTESDVESTDESKTIKKLRPKIFQTRNSSKNKSDNFDNILNSDNASNKDVSTQNKSAKSTSLQQKEASINKERRKLSSSMSSDKINQSNTKTSNNETMPRGGDESKLRNSKLDLKKHFNETLRKRSDTTRNKANDSITDNLRKQRPTLFSQESKKQTETNLFDAALEENSKSTQHNTTVHNRSQSESSVNISQSSSTSDFNYNDEVVINKSKKISPKKTTGLLKEKKLTVSGNAFDEVSQTENLTTYEMHNINESSKNQSNSLKKNRSSQVLDNSGSSLKYRNKSRVGSRIFTGSSPNKSVAASDRTKNDSKEIRKGNESSSIQKYFTRTKSQVHNTSAKISDTNYKATSFKQPKALEIPKDIDVEDHISSNKVILSRSIGEDLSDATDNRNINASNNSRLSWQRQSTRATSRQSRDKSSIANQSNQLHEKSQQSGHEVSATKTAGTPKVSNLSKGGTRKISEGNKNFTDSHNKELLKLKINRVVSRNSPSTEDDLDDDLLRTPHPAQSTLNPSGRPFTRLTEFRGFETDENSSPHNSRSLTKKAANAANSMRKDKSTSIQKRATATMENSRPIEKKTQLEFSKNATIGDSSVWEDAKRRVDLIKQATLVNIEREKKLDQEAEQKSKRTDIIVKRTLALEQAQVKRKKRKPVNKAYYVDGKVYKQPKLSRPKSWVTDKLYKYLWSCMEPIFGVKTRIESEKFVKVLSDIYTAIVRKKKYASYSNLLEDLLVTMANLKLIKNRYDFYRFCSDFMPYNFRIKVVPMKLPGNTENIPYDENIVYEPILEENDSDSNSISNND